MASDDDAPAPGSENRDAQGRAGGPGGSPPGHPLSAVQRVRHPGVSLQGVTLQTLLQPVPLGIVLGLVVGKTVGVFGASWLMVRLAGAKWPSGAGRRQFVAMCVLCGIGFTMSLFIGGLAFEDLSANHQTQLKIGVLAGSLLAALLGSALMLSGRNRPPDD